MSLAAALKPKAGGVGGGLGGGWLSMAPQVDDDNAGGPSTSSRHITPPSRSPLPPAHTYPAGMSLGYQNPRPRVATTAPKRILPRTNARFKVGDSSQLTTPCSPAPESPYSRGSDYDSPPPFDVRASFAPMPKWGASSSKSVSEELKPESNQSISNGHSMDLDERLEDELEADEARTSEVDEDEEKGIYHGGIQWKGKTAHAVELEMEALGDRTVMSYAPDAVYLASRLEGLKRNLEAGGDRLRRRAWEDFEEEQDQQQSGEEMALIDKHASLDDGTVPALIAPANESVAPSLDVSEKLTPDDEVVEDPLKSIGVVAGGDDKPAATTIADPIITAKEAALDARVEIRTLRRPDLEQVRELHCYHGQSDKVDTESYTTSAGFLLRLLVDEHHVCLVAVAKPLPEPPSLPSRFSPGAPPPSLDMPPTRSPFLVAGQQRHTVAPMLKAALGASSLSRPPHASSLLVEATAPRSFGVGGSSSNSSKDEGIGETEGRDPRNLMDAAKEASREYTRRASSHVGPIEEEEEGEQEEEEAEMDEDEQSDDDRVSPTSSPSGDSSNAQQQTILAGPTFDVAPPRAVRVMGAPPINGLRRDTEAILGVASARIKVVQRSQGDDLFGKSESLDASWPGLDSEGARSMVTREAHIITLSVLPGERGQGLGARLLDHLLDECKRRTAGPRIHLAAGSNTEHETDTSSRVHESAPMRTFMEVHPSNSAAVSLYHSRGFKQVEGAKGVVKHYFRGDNRIPNAIRVQVGGADAIRLERFDFR